MKVMTEEKIRKILQILKDTYPNAKTALRYETPFQLLIATMLSAQSTDKQVNKITRKLFKKCSSPYDFASLDQKELEKHIRSCGLYKSKAKNIIETSKIIVEKHGGKVPRNFNDLVKLPGVGRKTANVVLSNAFDIPAFAVDTHVHRVANRVGLANGKNPIETERDLMENVPKELWGRAHHWLIHHGRQICRARNPRCDRCPLRTLCEYEEKEI